MAQGGEEIGTNQKSSPGNWGLFKTNLMDEIDRGIALKLATYFDFTTAEVGKINDSSHPGNLFVLLLTSKDIICHNNVDKLLDALRQTGLRRCEEKVRGYFQEYLSATGVRDRRDELNELNLEGEQILTDNGVPLKHESYPYLSRSEFEEFKLQGTGILATRNEGNRKLYERRIQHYRLEDDVRLMTSEHKRELCIAILGKTGVGKSTTGNTILGRKAFQASQSSRSSTKQSSEASCSYKNFEITVADTPGIHDTHLGKGDVLRELARIAFLLRDGVHCFIICLSASDTRYTEDTESMLENIKPDGSEDFFNHCMVVYTKAETELDQFSLVQFLEMKKEHERNRCLLEAIDYRVVAVNNRSEVPAEIKRNREAILAMAAKVVDDNLTAKRSDVFTNKTFMKALELHDMISGIVEQKTFDPILMNATIETIINASVFKKVKEKTFFNEVITVLNNSESCTRIKDNGDLVIERDGNRFVVPRRDYEHVLRLIYREIKPNVKEFINELVKNLALLLNKYR